MTASGVILPSECEAHTCSFAYETHNFTINCPLGRFQAVTFTSFGTPTGSCAADFTPSSCDNTRFASNAVNSWCARNSTCWGYVSSSTAGQDPCPGVLKWIAIKSKCVYTAPNSLWIGQGLNILLPLVYLPFQGYVIIDGFFFLIYIWSFDVNRVKFIWFPLNSGWKFQIIRIKQIFIFHS